MSCPPVSPTSLSIGWVNVKEINSGSTPTCALGNGTGDDAPAINQCIVDATVPGGSGVVYLPPGQYQILTPIVVNKPCTIIGLTRGGGGRPKGSIPTAPVTILLGSLDMNGIEISSNDVALRDFAVYYAGASLPQTPGVGISVTDSQRVLLDNLSLDNIANGVLVDGSSDVIMKRCRYAPLNGFGAGAVYGFKMTNDEGQGAKRCRLLFCRADERDNSNGNAAIAFWITKGYSDVSLFACGALSTAEGVRVESDGGGVPTDVRVTLHTNDHAMTGFNLIDGGTVTISSSITGTADNGSLVVASTYSSGPITVVGAHFSATKGVSVSGAKAVSLAGCAFDGNTSGDDALALTASSAQVSITGCVFRGAGETSSIHIQASFAGNLACCGVVGVGGGGAGATTVGLQVDASSADFALQGCSFENYATAGVQDNGTNANRKIADVIGYNPRGVVPSPSVPPSGQFVTNATGVDCLVYVYGGTVTGILISGSGSANSTGLTGGAVRLPAGEQIAINYGVVAPQWIWFDE